MKLLTLGALLPTKARAAVALAGELQRTDRDHKTNIELLLGLDFKPNGLQLVTMLQ